MVDFPTANDVRENPRPVLSQFIIAVRDFIAEFVESGRDPKGMPLFEEALQNLMRRALADTMPTFKALHEKAAQLSDKSISEHGLSGDALRFKINVSNFRVNQFRTFGGFGLFRWALDAIEGLLDSIIDAAGVGGAVKELKEAIRNSTKE